MSVHETAMVENADVEGAELREYVTVHDSTLGSEVTVHERTSIKKSTIEGPTDVNANCYLENAVLGSGVQIGPNASIVGVTHDLGPEGMTYREDVFEAVRIEDGALRRGGGDNPAGRVRRRERRRRGWDDGRRGRAGRDAGPAGRGHGDAGALRPAESVG